MEENKDMIALLDKMLQPVFCVKEYTVVHANAAAGQLFLAPGTDIRPLLAGSLEEYEAFQDGCLYLSLTVSGQALSGCVQRVNDLDIFELDTGSESAVLRSLALVAAELRKPLGSALSNTEALLEELDDPNTRQQLSQLNKGLYRILRVLGNMSDAAEPGTLSRQETVNLPEVFEGIFQKASAMLAQAGITLEYEGLSEAVYSLADSSQLERAVLNILSNAAKFSPRGSSLRASLTRRGRVLRLTVQDSGNGIAREVMGSLFHRYLRQPGIEDSRFGLGLGIRLVHDIARQHGGTLLISGSETGGTQTVLTLAIRQPEQCRMCSPVFPMDLSGGYDAGLVELSDVLPAELFDGRF